MIWSTRPDGYHDYFNDRWYEYTGVPYGSTDAQAWSGMFHPDDREMARRVWSHSLDTGNHITSSTACGIVPVSIAG
jgi:hypothetical protein